MSAHDVYVGRFAPSPTGPLHFGSLVAALASFLDARHEGGRWLLRIEDLDPPRESARAPARIIEQLKAFGLAWDGEVLYQSQRLDAYAAALEQLAGSGSVYPCVCSRRSFTGIYPGRCRGRTFDDTDESHAVRFRVPDDAVSISDRIMGARSWRLDRDVGDFIVKRKDGLFAYQLAVVVDDAFQGISDVVRGNDLLDSTPRQVCLAHALGVPEVRYAHFPVITGTDGAKLSKQAHAAPVDTGDVLPVLRRALKALGQPEHRANSVPAAIDAAIDEWDIGRVPHALGIPQETL